MLGNKVPEFYKRIKRNLYAVTNPDTNVVYVYYTVDGLFFKDTSGRFPLMDIKDFWETNAGSGNIVYLVDLLEDTMYLIDRCDEHYMYSGAQKFVNMAVHTPPV